MITSINEAANWRDALHVRGQKVVFTSGCFDLLHAGHVRYLKQARALGDVLVIAMNSDASVRALKGPTRPVNSQDDRAEVLEALACVDLIVLLEDERSTKIIEKLRPHIFAKGGDYTIESLNSEELAALKSVGADIQILPLVPGKSTTATLQRAESRGPESKIGILGSGEGSNFDAIARAIDAGNLRAEIAIVISDSADAPILAKARQRGINAVFVNPGSGKSSLAEPAQKEIRDRLLAAGVDLVVLAGFMRLLKPPVLDDFAGRIVNIHPSLLPAYKGLEAWKQALDAGEKVTGCTVHMVDAQLDGGTVLGQSKVPILPGDTPESLHARIHEAEHVLFPKIIGQILASR